MTKDELKNEIDKYFPLHPADSSLVALHDKLEGNFNTFNITIWQEDENQDRKGQLGWVRNSGLGVYRMYLDVPEQAAKIFIETHEFGHIYFRHVCEHKEFERRFKQYEELLNEKWDLISSKFVKDALANNSKERIIKWVYRTCSNAAMDMEINSKFFLQDGKKVMDTVEREFLLKWLQEAGDGLDGLEKIDNVLTLAREGKSQDYCWPENKGWLPRKSWTYYIIKLIEDLDNFLDYTKLKAGGCPQGGIPGDALLVPGDVGGSDGGRDEGEGSGDSKNGDKDGSGSEEDSRDYNMGKGYGRAAEDTVTHEIVEKATWESLEALLRVIAFKQAPTLYKNDYLYYSRKGRNDVLNPKRYRVDKKKKGAVWFQVDVSPSVDFNLAKRVLQVINNFADFFDKKGSHLVQWHTHLAADNLFTEEIRHAGGGGTEMAEGMKYIFPKMKPGDIYIIVSDFEDTLPDWVEVAAKYPDIKKIGIKYVQGEQAITETDKLDGFKVMLLDINS